MAALWSNLWHNLLLPRIIGVMLHRRETLTPEERVVQERLMATLPVQKRKTDKQIVVPMVGLVGSGKSTVARALAAHIGATVVEGDAIRAELRKEWGERYDRARAIAENLALEVIRRGGNVILDSDFVDAHKRASLRERVRVTGVRIIFVRTHCNLDVMVGRILTASNRDGIGDFFDGASSTWKGEERVKGAVIKVREMVRRIPNHYRWVNKIGGRWVLRKLPFSVFSSIDTADEERWRRDAEECARRL